MAEIPTSVLSERFQTYMKGRRLKTGVFLTFAFDPGFFEQEVLPVFVDVPLSQSPALRLLQLEEAIQSQIDDLAVYYDAKALEAGAQSAKLDVRRMPVYYRTGVFHAKNVLLLLEDAEPDDAGYRTQHLVTAAMSCNLTRAGWWENVEVCHIEDVTENGVVGYRDDLLTLISGVKRACPEGEDHTALETVRRFVAYRLQQRPNARWDDLLYPRLYSGGMTVPEFLSDVLGGYLRDLNLEVISPFFDESDARPLRELIRAFEPREVRVFLPRGEDGGVLCSESYYDSVRKLPNTRWGQLPSSFQRMGKAENSAPRRLHAKVYRFFSPTRRYEALFVGSVNLTNAAHSKGGNFETGFLVETNPGRVSDWWLSTDGKQPTSYHSATEEEALHAGVGACLTIRYHWNKGSAAALWNADGESPALRLQSNGVDLFSLNAIPPRRWEPLSAEDALRLAERLPSTSYLTVLVEGHEPATILVQEEGMSHKPSLLMTLSAADILRYWALLTPEQRAAFIEERGTEFLAPFEKSGADPRRPLPVESASMFATFAGVFHSFGSLEKSVLAAIAEQRERDAVYRLFGRKYDSLPRLLDRVLNEEKSSDIVVRYVILLCARQLLGEITKRAPEFAHAHAMEIEELQERLEGADALRAQLELGDDPDREAFLDWFERWFLLRATPAEAVS